MFSYAALPPLYASLLNKIPLHYDCDDNETAIPTDCIPTCVVQKEFENTALEEKRISKIITLKKPGDYSFKFSPKGLLEVRKNDYDLAIIMERKSNKADVLAEHISSLHL